MGTGLSHRLPSAPEASIELLQRMLTFNAENRVSVDMALCSTVFSGIIEDHAAEALRPAVECIALDFEQQRNLDEQTLRNCFVDIVEEYHPGWKEISNDSGLAAATWGHLAAL